MLLCICIYAVVEINNPAISSLERVTRLTVINMQGELNFQAPTNMARKSLSYCAFGHSASILIVSQPCVEICPVYVLFTSRHCNQSTSCVIGAQLGQLQFVLAGFSAEALPA